MAFGEYRPWANVPTRPGNQVRLSGRAVSKMVFIFDPPLTHIVFAPCQENRPDPASDMKAKESPVVVI